MNCSTGDLIPYTELGGAWEDENSTLDIVCRKILFSITIRRVDVQGTRFWLDHSHNARSLENDPSKANHRAMADNVVQCCRKTIDQLTAHTPRASTVYDALHMDAYRIRLVKHDHIVDAEIVSGPEDESAYDLTAVDTSSLYLPSNIPHFDARDIFFTLDVKPNGRLSGPVLSSDKKRYFFKPCLLAQEDDFRREVARLSSIIALGLDKTVRTSRLAGLVYLESSTKVVGMLLDWIEGHSLATLNAHTSTTKALRETWLRQIQRTIQELHSHDILWADPNPYNIIIDANQNAWLVDFGGVCNTAMIDEALSETKAGDLQGVDELGKWLKGPHLSLLDSPTWC